MTAPREDWPKVLQDIWGGRPVRWAEPNATIGDYDGRERTLEVFNADARDPRKLLEQLSSVQDALERSAGGPVVVIFHTTKESNRLYADFVERSLQAAAAAQVASSVFEAPGDLASLPLRDKELRKRERGSPGSGSKELPRVGAP